MTKKVYKAGVKRETGFLYYIDKKGNICKVKMARGGSGGRGGATVIVKSGIQRLEGHLYFIDKQGDISCVAMSRGSRKRKATKKKASKKKRPRRRRKSPRSVNSQLPVFFVESAPSGALLFRGRRIVRRRGRRIVRRRGRRIVRRRGRRIFRRRATAQTASSRSSRPQPKYTIYSSPDWSRRIPGSAARPEKKPSPAGERWRICRGRASFEAMQNLLGGPPLVFVFVVNGAAELVSLVAELAVVVKRIGLAKDSSTSRS